MNICTFAHVLGVRTYYDHISGVRETWRSDGTRAILENPNDAALFKHTEEIRTPGRFSTTWNLSKLV